MRKKIFSSFPLIRPRRLQSIWKDFPILVPPYFRTAIREHLAALDIETRCYYDPPCHKQPALIAFGHKLPETERLAKSVLCLPFYASMTDAEMNYVVDGLVDAERKFC